MSISFTANLLLTYKWHWMGYWTNFKRTKVFFMSNLMSFWNFLTVHLYEMDFKKLAAKGILTDTKWFESPSISWNDVIYILGASINHVDSAQFRGFSPYVIEGRVKYVFNPPLLSDQICKIVWPMFRKKARLRWKILRLLFFKKKNLGKFNDF